jgi:hypothetical protein
MGKVQDIKKRIAVLERQLGEERKALRQTIIDKIMDIAENGSPMVKRISKHIVIINYSDLIGNPWSPSFYNWVAAADDVINYLLKAEPNCVEKWGNILAEHCKKAKGNVVEIPKVVNNNYIIKDMIRENKNGDGWVYAKYKINVNKDFIEKIIQAVNEL